MFQGKMFRNLYHSYQSQLSYYSYFWNYKISTVGDKIRINFQFGMSSDLVILVENSSLIGMQLCSSIFTILISLDFLLIIEINTNLISSKIEEYVDYWLDFIGFFLSCLLHFSCLWLLCLGLNLIHYQVNLTIIYKNKLNRKND